MPITMHMSVDMSITIYMSAHMSMHISIRISVPHVHTHGDGTLKHQDELELEHDDGPVPHIDWPVLAELDEAEYGPDCRATRGP